MNIPHKHRNADNYTHYNNLGIALTLHLNLL